MKAKPNEDLKLPLLANCDQPSSSPYIQMTDKPAAEMQPVLPPCMPQEKSPELWTSTCCNCQTILKHAPGAAMVSCPRWGTLTAIQSLCRVSCIKCYKVLVFPASMPATHVRCQCGALTPISQDFEPGFISLISADGHTYDVHDDVRKFSTYLLQIGSSKVNLGTPYFIVEKLAMYLNYLHINPPSENLETQKTPWEFEFTSMSNAFLFELLEAADSMGIKPLRNLLQWRIQYNLVLEDSK